MHVLNLITSPNVPPFQQQVAAIKRHGIEETTLGVPGKREIVGGKTNSRSISDYIRFYPRVLRSSFGPYDLVHANYGLTAPAALAQPNLPVVLSLWGSDLLGKMGALSKWCARLADAVIVMSPGMAEELDTDCHVIPHGVNLELFRPIPQRSARDAVGWRQDVHQVVFPYPPQRDVKDYPRAERIVDAARDRIEGEVILQAVQGVPHERIPLYMNAGDTLLLTSKWEGSPNTIKEAMACNLPIVSTDVGDVRERLADVDPSHVCRTDEELVAGLVDALERGPPSNGREAVKPFGLEAMGKRICDVYRSVL